MKTRHSLHLRLLLSSAASIIFALTIEAQPAGSATAPALRPPPNPGAWTITYQYADGRPKHPPRSQSVGEDLADLTEEAPVMESEDYAVREGIARRVTRYSDGTRTTAYVVGLIGILENHGKPGDLYIENFGVDFFKQSDFRNHFSSLEWIRPKYYQGVLAVGDVMCHYFVEPSTTPAPPSDQEAQALRSAPPTGREAWISSSGRPVQTRERGVVATYDFKSTKDIPNISVPVAYRTKAQKYLEALDPRESTYSGNR